MGEKRLRGLSKLVGTSGQWLQRLTGLRKLTAGCLIMFLAAPFAVAATTRPLQGVPGPQNESAANRANADATQTNGTPEDPGAASAQLVQRNPQPSSTPQQDQRPTNASPPVGTAAAPYEKPLGNAASRPAGAVIAPAKQRRTRSILIKVAVILGAAVAIGAVAGLSKASPSRP